MFFKRCLSIVLISTFIISLLNIVAFAANEGKSLDDNEKLAIQLDNSLLLYVNSSDACCYGELKPIDKDYKVAPLIKNGKTMVPLRFVAESLNAKVSYSDSNIIITKKDKTIELKLKTKHMKINGVDREIEATTELIYNRTYVPVREVAEALGSHVLYQSGLIIISDNEIKSLDQTVLNNYIYLLNSGNLAYIDAKTTAIISEMITPGMSELEKVMAIYNYVIAHFENAHYMGEIIFGTDDGITNSVITNKAYIFDYAKAIKMLCDKVKIDCKIILGSSNNRNASWNIVKVNGQYYHLNAFWPDMDTSNRTSQNFNYQGYKYFLVSDKKMNSEFNWSSSIKCNSTAYECIGDDIEKYCKTENFSCGNISAYKNNSVYFYGIESIIKYDVISRKFEKLKCLTEEGQKRYDWFYYSFLRDGWIYFSGHNGLERIKYDGSNRQIISPEDTTACNLILKNGYLYYNKKCQSPEYFRVKIDGTERVQISSEITRFGTIKDDWIYYSREMNLYNNAEAYNAICRVKIDGSNQQTIVEKAHISFHRIDDNNELKYYDCEAGKYKTIQVN